MGTSENLLPILLFSPPIRINPRPWSSCPPSLVGASQPGCGLCSLRSALRAGSNSATFAAEPRAWRRVCGQQWVMNCPGWGLWQCQPSSEGPAELLSYRPCVRLLLPPFPLAPGIHLKHKVRRAPASFWFTKGSAQGLGGNFPGSPIMSS